MKAAVKQGADQVACDPQLLARLLPSHLKEDYIVLAFDDAAKSILGGSTLKGSGHAAMPGELATNSTVPYLRIQADDPGGGCDESILTQRVAETAASGEARPLVRRSAAAVSSSHAITPWGLSATTEKHRRLLPRASRTQRATMLTNRT